MVDSTQGGRLKAGGDGSGGREGEPPFKSSRQCFDYRDIHGRSYSLQSSREGSYRSIPDAWKSGGISAREEEREEMKKPQSYSMERERERVHQSTVKSSRGGTSNYSDKILYLARGQGKGHAFKNSCRR